jgi:acyl-homoserine lactone acylase PvdQ
MGNQRGAEASLAVMDEDTMVMLEGYARGVNAWIDAEPAGVLRQAATRIPDPWL